MVEQREGGEGEGEELLVLEARNVGAELKGLRWSYRQLVFPYMKVGGGGGLLFLLIWGGRLRVFWMGKVMVGV